MLKMNPAAGRRLVKPSRNSAHFAEPTFQIRRRACLVCRIEGIPSAPGQPARRTTWADIFISRERALHAGVPFESPLPDSGHRSDRTSGACALSFRANWHETFEVGVFRLPSQPKLPVECARD